MNYYIIVRKDDGHFFRTGSKLGYVKPEKGPTLFQTEKIARAMLKGSIKRAVRHHTIRQSVAPEDYDDMVNRLVETDYEIVKVNILRDLGEIELPDPDDESQVLNFSNHTRGHLDFLVNLIDGKFSSFEDQKDYMERLFKTVVRIGEKNEKSEKG